MDGLVRHLCTPFDADSPKGNSLLGFIAILVSIAPLLFWHYGETLRKKYDVQFD